MPAEIIVLDDTARYYHHIKKCAQCKAAKSTPAMCDKGKEAQELHRTLKRKEKN